MPPGLPPSLRSSTIAQTWRFMTNPFPLFAECATLLGPIFTVRLMGQGNWVLLSRPEHLKQLYTGDSERLHAGEANARLFRALLGTESLVSLDADAHLKRRRLLTPPLHGDRMRVYGSIMRDLTEEMAARWPKGRVFSLLPELHRLVIQIIQRTIFGPADVVHTTALAELLPQLVDVAAGSPLLLIPPLQINLGRFSPWGRIEHLLRRADEAIHAQIERRRRSARGDDVLSLLLDARDEQGLPFRDRELRDELVTMLLAGSVTTSSSLSWAFERLLRSPRQLKLVLAELERVAGSGPLQPEHISQLAYLDASIRESMRVRPTVSVSSTRLLKAPFEVGGYVLPAGTVVANCIYLAHRQPDIYPNPERFEPERFLGKREMPYQWMPFGGGVRRCIGMAFAMHEMKVIMATVLKCVRFEALAEDAAHARRGWFVVPKRGLEVRILAGVVPRAAASGRHTSTARSQSGSARTMSSEPERWWARERSAEGGG